ncbi:hypothetical protein VIN01S_24840 [Vibrio inusitatus NBRC 102082]|uniref:Uncharacterized protein n=1 Tax=Vibrio inusitatus NBRC 102082 TaxID=1219070 RepID=A0A4Y3HY87_9VIBR|nr:capsule biosynthesis GfcC family protein [Vibrio inusitatus]GEA51680.1 hypothetical protein VIN01S_24840 [Vibrio inusitatus NBRC 102082]
MKGINKVSFAFLVSVLMLSADTAWSSALIIAMPNQKTELHYSKAVRLSQVLIDAHRLEPAAFTIANHLSLLDEDSKMKPEIDEVFQQLYQRANKPNNVSLNQSSHSILEQLKHFSYLRRLPYTLDADWARSQISSDPILQFKSDNPELRFQLLLTTRPTQIRIIGAIDKPKLVSFHVHWQLPDYLEHNQIELLPGAKASTAFVIQPDGVVELISYGWWNGKEVYFAPGSTIFIGLRSLASENEDLNLQIAELLTHKVGL